MKPFFFTIPHSGERVPDFCEWLASLPETTLMCDVDRYVDILYEGILSNFDIPLIKTEWHRYAADLNRLPEDIDCDSVVDSTNSSGSFSRGFHWVRTTTGLSLMQTPMTREKHDQLVKLVFDPFHTQVKSKILEYKRMGEKDVYHIDAHSMPSVGTLEHRDPGERRADIVVSDSMGKSSKKEFVDLIISSFARAGFKVGYNWPYFGGRVTEQYGNPPAGVHTVQVELNRALYMSESSKKLLSEKAKNVEKKLQVAISLISSSLDKI